MEYKISKNIELEAGDFCKLTDDVKVNSHDLQEGQIVKITKTTNDQIIFIEFYITAANPTNSYGRLKHILDKDDAFFKSGDQFSKFLESLSLIHTPELVEANIPRYCWSEEHLLNYISFLEDNANEFDVPVEIERNDILEIIEFLDQFGDDEPDNLGKTCKKHSQVLKHLLTTI